MLCAYRQDAELFNGNASRFRFTVPSFPMARPARYGIERSTPCLILCLGIGRQGVRVVGLGVPQEGKERRLWNPEARTAI